jgi:hypothetical protein
LLYLVKEFVGGWMVKFLLVIMLILTQFLGIIWKNAPKNEIMNRIICHSSPFVTIFVCNPWYVPSRTKFRNHSIIVRIIIALPVNNNSWLDWWNHLIISDIVTRAPIAPVSGQGPMFN